MSSDNNDSSNKRIKLMKTTNSHENDKGPAQLPLVLLVGRILCYMVEDTWQLA
jgi:hypothetical protein